MKPIESGNELKELAESIMFFERVIELPHSILEITIQGMLFIIFSAITLYLLYDYFVKMKERKQNGYYQNRGKSKGYKKAKRALIFSIVVCLVLTGVFANIFLTSVNHNNKFNKIVNEPNKVIKGEGYVVKTNKDNTEFKINNIAPSDKTNNRVAVDLENKKTHKAYRMYWIKNKNHDDEITVS